MELKAKDLLPYLPMDRRQAIATAQPLPEFSHGAALFADISGFTPLTRTLAQHLGRKAGAEEVSLRINAVYTALIEELHRYSGSVIGFAGDSITCWLDDAQGDAPLRAVSCALAMQEVMKQFTTIKLGSGDTISLGLKTAVAAGPVRRFQIADPQINLIDALAGTVLLRVADAEQQAANGETVVTQEVAEHLGSRLNIREWRGLFACIDSLNLEPTPSPWPSLSGSADTTIIRPWVLAPVFQQLSTGGTFRGDLRPVTPMFVRFSGLDFDHDPAVSEKLDTYMRWAQQIVTQYGGTLIQLTIGDKGAFIYIVFGAPTVYDNDPQRALLCALTLQNPPPELAFIGPLQIGLSRGEVWTGQCGSPTRHIYSVMGNHVNLSARLMMQARPGQIIVSDAMSESNQFLLRLLGKKMYKGFDKLITTYEVLGEKQVDERSYGEQLVGRDQELRALQTAVQPLFNNQFAGGATLFGEPGIGKSMLSDSLRRILDSGVTWLIGQTDQVFRRALNPFIYLLKGAFDQFGGADLGTFNYLFEQHLNDLAANQNQNSDVAALHQSLQSLHPYLAAMLDLHWEDSAYEKEENPQLRYQKTLLAIKQYLFSLSMLKPLVIELEDAHWLDENSLDLLQQLSSEAAAYPIFFLITSRYKDDGSKPLYPVAPQMPHIDIDLQALSNSGLQQLAHNSLGGTPSKELLSLLAERSHANPFFARQLIHFFVENGWLKQDKQGIWNLTNITKDAIPTSINAVLVAQIDRLDRNVKDVMKAAAVFGREFELHLLAEMVDDDVFLGVESAMERQICIELNALRYSFKHALLHDAAYEMQLRTRLRELHERAANAYESLYELDLAPYYGLLAYHYALAEIDYKEYWYCQLAAIQATNEFNHKEAIRLYSRALVLTDPADLLSRFNLLQSREKAHHFLANRTQQGQDLLLLQDLAQQMDDGTPEAARRRAEIALRFAEYAEVTNNYNGAINAARSAVDFLQNNDAAPGIKTAAMLRWGTALLHQRHYWEAKNLFHKGLTLCRTHNLTWQHARLLNNIGITHVYLNEFTEANQYILEAMHYFTAENDRHGLVKTNGNLGILQRRQNNLPAARTYYKIALQLSREIGDRWSEGDILFNLGLLLKAEGDYKEAVNHLNASLKLQQAVKDTNGEATLQHQLGLLHFSHGAVESARQHQQAAWILSSNLNDQSGKEKSSGQLGQIALYLGQFQLAAKHLKTAVSMAKKNEDTAALSRYLILLSQATTHLDQYDNALHHAQNGVEAAAETQSPRAQFASHVQLGDILLANNQLVAARQAYQTALDLSAVTPHLAWSGLAQIAWSEKRQLDALTWASQAITKLPAQSTLQLRIFAACLPILQSSNDPRADQIARQATQLIQEKAKQIKTSSLRRSFLAAPPQILLPQQ